MRNRVGTSGPVPKGGDTAGTLATLDSHGMGTTLPGLGSHITVGMGHIRSPLCMDNVSEVFKSPQCVDNVPEVCNVIRSPQGIDCVPEVYNVIRSPHVMGHGVLEYTLKSS